MPVPENEFRIEGRIDGLGDSAVIVLYKREGNVGKSIAQDTVAGGRFSFTVPMTENAKLSISGDYGDNRFPSYGREIWAAPGEKVTVTGDSTLVHTWKVESSIPRQREEDAYMLLSENEYIRVQQLSIEEKKARNIADRNVANAVIDSLRVLESELYMTIRRNDIALMERTPFSDTWLDILQSLAGLIKYGGGFTVFRDDVLRLYERLTPKQKELPAAQDIRISLFPPEKVGVGDRMADAELKALDGTVHRLSDYLGRYIILDFWSSGCGPCFESVPEMGEIARKYPDRLKIIGINTDTSEEMWRHGMETFKYESLNLNAPLTSDIDECYGVTGVPHFVIISPKGIILDQWFGYGKGIIEQRLGKHLNGE